MSKIPKTDSEESVEEEPSWTPASLPPEALSTIFCHLKVADRGRAARVCSTWRAACYNSLVWRDILFPWSHELMSADPVLSDSIVERGIRRIRLTDKAGLGLDEVASNFPTLLILELDMCDQVTDAAIPTTLLQKIPNLTELSLIGCVLITDAVIQRIADNLGHVTNLKLVRCLAITDASLLAIASGLKKLTKLDLGWCSTITDAGIGYLTGSGEQAAVPLPKLVTLELFACSALTDRSMLNLSVGQPTLERLNMQFCHNLTDAGLKYLSKLPKLVELHLPHTDGIRNTGLRFLSDSRSIQELIFDRATITDFSPLVRMTSLRRLTFDGCPELKDAQLVHLGRIPSLDTLCISYCPISNAGLENLADGGSNISGLELGLCLKLTDDCLKSVSRLERLRDLSLRMCQSIRGDGLAHLSEGAAKLTRLAIQSSSVMDSRIFGHVMRLTQLQGLSLGRVEMTPEVLNQVATGLPNLRTFTVDHKNRFDDILKLRINPQTVLVQKP